MSKILLPIVMGHRGAAALAPENTLAGFRVARACGADWVEFDVMLTGDDRPVLFHDDKLQRTTGHPGLMAESAFDDIRDLDAGSWFGADFAGEPIPPLPAAVAALRALGLRANIEIKPSEGREKVTATVALETLSDIWPADAPPPLISSFKPECLEIARRVRPSWPRALIALRVPENWRDLLAALDCAAFHVHWENLTEPQVRAIKAAGYGLASFTINDLEVAARLAGWGADCLIGDDPGALLKALAVP
jgi:glycerophosphoryl diester phosphodiesterase